MDIELVNPQLRDMVRRAPKVNVASGVMRVVGRLGSRYLVPAARVEGVSVKNVRAGGARLRLYVPDRCSGAGLVWIHGGGMVIGAPRQDDRFCAQTAARLGIVIVSADYRMAPEHPYPVPQQDCLAAWDWLQSNAASLRVADDRIALGGGSAGGGLAASVAGMLSDRGARMPAALWLLYPMLDDRTAADTGLDALDHPIWNNTSNRVGWGALLRGTAVPGDANVPADAAPARRDAVHGFPPTWIGVGSIDLFHHEDVEYAKRLQSAGVPTRLDLLPGAPHGFESLAPEAPVVESFIDGARDWLADSLGAAKSADGS